MSNAKIVCTLGPASASHERIRALADAGMTVARVNSSHGTREERRDLLERIREVDRESAAPLASMVDLQGPEIRTAPVEEPVDLVEGSEVRFVEGDDASASEVGLSISIAGASPGDRVLVDDGRIEATVERVDGDAVVARVESGGELGARKGVNVPGLALDLDVVTEDDREDLELAVEQEADFVAASFVRTAEDVLAVAGVIEDLGGDVPVVAKLERSGAIDHLEDIVEAAYGVMVARGDLGVEYPLQEVPLIQKRVVRRCRETGTPVIIATEMLDSMVHARRPTRAEASDVANAVLDGTDAVMLSAETAIGDDPVRVVETMDTIVSEVEASEEYADLREQRVPGPGTASADSLARAARYLSRDVGASAVVAASESGYTALKTAKYRPEAPIVAATPDEGVRRRLALSWGIRPVHVDYVADAEDVIRGAVDAVLDVGAAESGDTVVVLSGMMTGVEGTDTTNMLKVHVAAETLATGQGTVPGRVVGPLAYAGDGLENAPEGAILAVPGSFEGPFDGDLSRIGGIVAARRGMTGYAAIVARELGVPMVSGASLAPADVAPGTTVTVDAERGIVYEGDVLARERAAGAEITADRRP
ncbi:pyruvate kinase [Halomarina ordinaria]|uniref:Pyruvate kinase n=1 Tax=Halomarina ordinaria TaxID=3033939 RepID=A0ABD5U8T4_9EURY|nr:pyruvate kinase [Halomarina sp. PSRA2]